MRERHDDDCSVPFEDNHLAGPTCPTRKPKKKRKPHQISVRGATYDKLQAAAHADNKSVAELTDEIIIAALDRKLAP